MPTRREFCQSMACLALSALVPIPALAMLPSEGETKAMPEPVSSPAKSLLQLQQEFVDLRFGMFVHFNMATFQDREWGDPNGPVEAFDPTDLDTDQWADAALSAGMTYGCLTTKHHDGFCLWPTKTDVASISQTPKKIDVVGRYAESFRKKGLKVGMYYSILDLRNEIRHFDVTPEKVKLMKDQLTELLTNYGPINVLIFDGWDAPWSRIPYTELAFDEIRSHVKSIQPECLVCELNASQFPDAGMFYTEIKSFEQNAGQMLPDDNKLPALSCVTLTDGWFWKQKDATAELKSVDQVVNEWLIPQNERFCNQILNAAPNREGKLAPNLVKRLAEIGAAWKHGGAMPKIEPSVMVTTLNLATGRPIRCSSSPDTIGPDMANDGNFKNSWCPDYGQSEGWLEVSFDEPTEINLLCLSEPIGRWNDYQESRIASYTFQVWRKDGWHTVAEGKSPHRVQFHRIGSVTTTQVRLVLVGNRDMPHVSEIGVYNEPVID